MPVRKLTSLDDIAAADYNPRTITAEALDGLAKSVEHFGDISGIVWNSRTGHLVAGHQRMKVLRSLHGDGLSLARRGETGPQWVGTPDGQEFPIRVVDWDEDRERLANIAANNPEIAGMFTASVVEMVKDLEATELGPLAADLRIDTMVGNLELPGEPAPGLTDPDAVPPVQEKPVSRTGDLWVMGDHRTLCGDSTKAVDVERVMGGEKAGLLLTDPPYGVAYVGKTKDALKIANDAVDEKDLQGLIVAAFDLAELHSNPGAYWYATVPARPLHLLFANDWKRRGILRQIVVWAKDSLVLGHSEYHYQHEPILFGWTPGRRHKNADRTRTSLWKVDRPKASREHPTMKPVELWLMAMRDGSREAEIVLDPFLGSGTTLIAAEQLGRRCFGLEIEPCYVDVIVRRYQKFTGKAATLDGDGRTFDAQAAGRGKM